MRPWSVPVLCRNNVYLQQLCPLSGVGQFAAARAHPPSVMLFVPYEACVTISSTAGFSSSTRSPMRKAAASASAAWAAEASSRAWTMASGLPLGPDALAGRGHLGEADGMVDGVVLAAPAAAEVDDGEAHGADVDAGDDAGALGMRLDGDRRRGEVVVGALEQVGGAAERGDHAREGLGRRARLQRRPRVAVEPLQVAAAARRARR